MANYTLLANGIYAGLTTDTKPTNANVPAGTILYEFLPTTYRTFSVYVNNGTEWIPSTFNSIEGMPSINKHGVYWGTGSAGAATGMWQGVISATAVGTGAFSSVQLTSAGTRSRSSTGTTINSLCGHRVNVLHTERDLNPEVEFKVSFPTAVTTMRAFLGYTSSAAAPASAADPLANLKGVGFWYDSAVDTEWMIVQNDGSATSDATTIVNIATADTAVHTYAIRADNTNSKFQYSYAGGAWADINTKIPAATDTMTVHWYIECLANSAARTLDVYWVQGRQSG